MGLLQNLFKRNKTEEIQQTAPIHTTESGVEIKLMNYAQKVFDATFDGDKFPGSFGLTKDYTFVDYYTLRIRSTQLFKENLYARGMIKRLIRNEIAGGLNLDADPHIDYLGISEEQGTKWTEAIETLYALWAADPMQCDWKHEKQKWQIDEEARQTAIISGDVLQVQRFDQKTLLPIVEYIDGVHIQTPLGYEPRNGNKILYGVEMDKQGRHVAYHVQTWTGTTFESRRIPCYGEKSKRRIAKLIYGSDKLIDDVRGEPLLAAVFYMLKELDRYRDAELRAAVVNAMLAYFIKSENGGPGSRNVTGGAQKSGSITVNEPQGERKTNFAINRPGVVFEEMNAGEEPVSFDTKRPNANYKQFEQTVIDSIAWFLELPPEIARLLFQSNFSASRQANNEFNGYLQVQNKRNGANFCQPIYENFAIVVALQGTIPTPGLKEAARSGDRNTVKAWTHAEWSGISRPSVDLKKDVDALTKGIEYRVVDYDFTSRRLTGQSFKTILKKLALQNKMLEQYGISSKADETNNGEPIAQPTPAGQPPAIEPAAILSAIEELSDDLEDLKN
jgi:lambda family phage portal protein